MYVILVYDVNEERVNKVLKCARKYLTWIQNSVLEGEITEAKYEKLKTELRKIIDEQEDSLLFYKFKEAYYARREEIGVTKGNTGNII
jgi:CRISPR-associated protein Cas2